MVIKVIVCGVIVSDQFLLLLLTSFGDLEQVNLYVLIFTSIK